MCTRQAGWVHWGLLSPSVLVPSCPTDPGTSFPELEPQTIWFQGEMEENLVGHL